MLSIKLSVNSISWYIDRFLSNKLPGNVYDGLNSTIVAQPCNQFITSSELKNYISNNIFNFVGYGN